MLLVNYVTLQTLEISDVQENISLLAEVIITGDAPTYCGTRMGRKQNIM
jgi:hypothetical protein